MTAIKENLQQLYLNTDYICSEINVILKINFNNPELDMILLESNLSTALFITAWNPQSIDCDEEFNNLKNTELSIDLSKFKYFKGIGNTPSYAGEESFLVIGITFDDAKKLQIKYNQKAIVFYNIGSVAELVY